MDKSKVVYLNNGYAPTETPFYEKHWFKVLGRLVTGFIGSIPPLRRYISKTIPYLHGRIPKLYHEGNYIEALELSILGITKCYKDDEWHHYWWWSFMSYAVYCAQSLENSKIINHLIEIADKGLRPFEGSRVAYCFCTYFLF